MVDFEQRNVTKNPFHEFTDPIADVVAFNTIVSSVITDNPFGCVVYMTAMENHDPV